MAEFEISRMSLADLATAVDWAATEGWNPGLADAAAFHAADPAGFFMGRLDGAPVCCVSTVRYGTGFGFLGMYIAVPAARGQGHGIAVWRAGMAHVAGRNVALDGVPAQVANYRKSGFREAWRHLRFEGVLPALPGAARGLELRDARAVAFDRIAAFDRRHFAESREGFLSLWFGLPDHVGVAALRDGDMVGLAAMRPCRVGVKIGPFYATDDGVATALLGALHGAVAGRRVAIDMPSSNPAALRLAKGLGLVASFETARMYTGEPPQTDAARIYAVASLELG